MRLRLLFFAWLFFAIFLWGSKSVLAQACGGSGGCQVTPYPCYDDMGYPDTCYADPCDGTCDQRDCPPAQYSCSRGCCDVGGEGEEPPGSNRECKGPQNVSCPTAENVDWGSCTKWFERTPTVCSLGNAQYYDDLNCKTDPEGQEVCRTGVVVTCGCCPAGTVSAFTYSPGPTWIGQSLVAVNYDEVGVPAHNCYGGQRIGLSYACNSYRANRRCEPSGDGVATCGYGCGLCQGADVKVYSCTDPCNMTYPANLSYNSAANRLTWTPGTGGTTQYLYVGEDINQVYNRCPAGSSCAVSVSLGTAVNQYQLPGLDPASGWLR